MAAARQSRLLLRRAAGCQWPARVVPGQQGCRPQLSMCQHSSSGAGSPPADRREAGAHAPTRSQPASSARGGLRPQPPGPKPFALGSQRPQQTIHLAEASGTSFGSKIWPSARLLVAHLAASEGERPLSGQRVLELGCGVGLAGIAAAALGARVVLTDRDEEALRQAAANIAQNRPAIERAGGAASCSKL
eukprot:SAG22_NODE_260_length_13403_cov_57.915589_9_plen_190_part_00